MSDRRGRVGKTKRRTQAALAAAAALVVRHAVAGTDLHRRLGVVRGGRAHPLLNLAGHCQEGLLDVARVLGRGLEKGDAQAVGELLGDLVVDDLLLGHIALVADEQLVDALGGVPVNLLQPLLDVVERVHVGDVVDDADAVGAAVVRGGDCAEALLAGRVPLQGG